MTETQIISIITGIIICLIFWHQYNPPTIILTK
jgi:hypothetical protein